VEFIIVIPREVLLAGASFFLGWVVRHHTSGVKYFLRYGAWPSRHSLQEEACRVHSQREV
jgi:hypothetical protein